MKTACIVSCLRIDYTSYLSTVQVDMKHLLSLNNTNILLTTLPPSRSIWCMKKIDLVYFANLIWHQELIFHSRKSYFNKIWRWLDRGGYYETVWMKEAMKKCQEYITLPLWTVYFFIIRKLHNIFPDLWLAGKGSMLASDWLSHFPALDTWMVRNVGGIGQRDLCSQTSLWYKWLH